MFPHPEHVAQGLFQDVRKAVFSSVVSVIIVVVVVIADGVVVRRFFGGFLFNDCLRLLLGLLFGLWLPIVTLITAVKRVEELPHLLKCTTTTHITRGKLTFYYN